MGMALAFLIVISSSVAPARLDLAYVLVSFLLGDFKRSRHVDGSFSLARQASIYHHGHPVETRHFIFRYADLHTLIHVDPKQLADYQPVPFRRRITGREEVEALSDHTNCSRFGYPGGTQ